MRDPKVLLKVNNLKVAYGGIQAVKGISLEVREGELVSLIGSNGAGKTTTMKAITGSLIASAGRIEYLGRDIRGQGSWDLVKQGLVMVPEGRGVFTRMSILENLQMGAYLRRDKAGIQTDIERVFHLFPRLKERSVQLAGTPTAPTAAVSTNTTQLATTAFVQNNKVSPAFSGTPTAPTAAYNTNTTQIATTAFVQGEKLSPAFSGTPTATTAAYNTNTTQIATTAFVQGEKLSPAFSGAPTAPTAANGTSNTQIASTQFVDNSLNNLGSMSVQNANAVAITGGSISGIVPLALTDGGTGASTPAVARTNLQLGDLATQNVGNVFITGGQITGIIDLAIADGGTGASTAADARTNLGLATGAVTTVGTMSTQNANAVNITGGDISGITPLPVASGGTAGGTAAQARTNLSVPPNSRTITGINGLTGGGDLSADRTITIASNSNGYGNRYVNTGAPSIPGVTGDIWYQII
jgi:energy-coupling factor transporter ATP-binding protein EcfA2